MKDFFTRNRNKLDTVLQDGVPETEQHQTFTRADDVDKLAAEKLYDQTKKKRKEARDKVVNGIKPKDFAETIKEYTVEELIESIQAFDQLRPESRRTISITSSVNMREAALIGFMRAHTQMSVREFLIKCCEKEFVSYMKKQAKD